MDHILSADEIWAADDIREDVVSVPEWGGSVRIRALTLKQVAGVATASLKRNPKTNQDETDRETVMLMTLIEGMIEPQLTMLDAKRLLQKSASVVTRIVAAVNALGATEEAINGATKSTESELVDSLSVFAGPRAQDDAKGTSVSDVDR